MGEVRVHDPLDVDRAIEILTAANPAAPAGDVRMYATAWVEWRYANDNITEHGTIVAHPRTGAPIENPYIKVRKSAMETMQRLKSIRRTDPLWKTG